MELTEQEKIFAQRLKGDPNAHAYCLLAAVLQAIANLAASLATTQRPRAQVHEIVVALVATMTALQERRQDWSEQAGTLEAHLGAFIKTVPDDLKPTLGTYLAKIREARAVGPAEGEG
ncbi:hypothetical protein [Nannocystis bainbridge]|uniref:Uncharacterized protein n=1 Tax=Nannocystis bainbridge TaxID=2995303 RepID=A0ABT5E0M8_9BACT|nr:hypothetical protein [Nannocystis bainbridge]MDC0719429.1 hypothetical protein [Nannocystis bainbridge]